MKPPILHTTVAAVAFFAAAALPLAHAQTLNVGRKVNRDELRECLDAGDSIKARNEDLKARSARINTVSEELKVEADAIKQESERQEGSSSLLGGRDRLERRKQAYGQKLASVKAEAEKFTPEADALNKDLAAYNQRCSGISYSKEDREAIMKEREAPKK
ncbi:MAG: hypothetical protein ACJ8GO_15345 [Ramlibacter sp.]